MAYLHCIWQCYIYCELVKMLYLIGPNGLVNLSFENFQKNVPLSSTPFFGNLHNPVKRDHLALWETPS